MQKHKFTDCTLQIMTDSAECFRTLKEQKYNDEHDDDEIAAIINRQSTLQRSSTSHYDVLTTNPRVHASDQVLPPLQDFEKALLRYPIATPALALTSLPDL